MTLFRLSERVSPTGGLHAEGLANILGRPALDPLTLVLREAGQNAWDARVRSAESGQGLRMLVRVRTLSPEQHDLFRGMFANGDAHSAEPLSTDLLSHQLAIQAPLTVLEICDFGTLGLVGGTDPTADQGNFVRFFFDVGTAHMGGGDGGTYGYGRSSLYLAGRTRTILVDSQVHGAGAPRRIMACRLGSAYTKKRLNGSPLRFTGRHFWGGEVQGDHVLPLEGEAAVALSAALGMPERQESDSGTSILIPWPDLPATDVGRHIAHVLLHNLWPKLVEVRGRRPMDLEVEVDGVGVPVPNPRHHPQYAPFAAALQLVRNPTPATGVIPIEVGAARMTTGYMAMEATHAAPIPAPPEPSDGKTEHEFARGVHHVALMRPSELVVRYLPFPGVAPDTQWGGVFMCAAEPQIRDAFAASEPPAHDDWVPDRLKDFERTVVRVSLRRIREHVDRHFAVSPTATSAQSASGNVSLASAADRFAGEFLSGDGTGAALVAGGGGGGGGVGRSLGLPRFDSLRVECGRTIARFSVDCSSPVPAAKAAAWVITGGRSRELVPADICPPVVEGWLRPDGEWTSGDECQAMHPGRHFVDVSFQGRYAIDVRLETVEP